jgi:hypothetical protein
VKRLVYTVTFGSVFHDMAKLTHPHIRKYAERHNYNWLFQQIAVDSDRLRSLGRLG